MPAPGSFVLAGARAFRPIPPFRPRQEAQLPQRNSASAAHVYLGWLTDRSTHRTPQNRRCYTKAI